LCSSKSVYDPSQRQYTDVDIESVYNMELFDIPEQGIEYSEQGDEQTDFYIDDAPPSYQGSRRVSFNDDPT
jgi:hypothetical protein